MRLVLARAITVVPLRFAEFAVGVGVVVGGGWVLSRLAAELVRGVDTQNKQPPACFMPSPAHAAVLGGKGAFATGVDDHPLELPGDGLGKVQRAPMSPQARSPSAARHPT